MLLGRLEPLLVKVRCGEFVALARLAKGIRRDEVAILESGSCGEGGMNRAVAIHTRVLKTVLCRNWRRKRR